MKFHNFLLLLLLTVLQIRIVLKVSVKEESGNDESVTVRLYGPNTEYVIDRERELQVDSLSNIIICLRFCCRISD